MSPRITALDVLDIRFPTSTLLDGSDAMNPDPDYSAAYVILRTADPRWPEGHGFTFTIGRGTEVVVSAIEALRPIVLGRETADLFADIGAFWRDLVGDSQLRWIGPEKGAVHLATAAIVNATWDLWAKTEQKPLWQLLVDMPPEEIVRAVDFRYLADFLTPDQALDILRSAERGRDARRQRLEQEGFPAYTTSVGWLGYSDEKIRRLCEEALAAGWTRFKIKVGRDLEDDERRARIVREAVGRDSLLMMDANQWWDVPTAIRWMKSLASYEPYWIEEPTSPDDVLGHRAIGEAIRPIRVATGEHVQNRIMFKQFLASGAIDVCQLDACRVGGVNEAIAVLLLAARAGVPVCPHAGGVGLCELVQHLSIFDYVAVSGELDGRMIEYVDHLHEHFLEPVVVEAGRYRMPRRPGYSGEMKADSLRRYQFPNGEVWLDRMAPAERDRGADKGRPRFA